MDQSKELEKCMIELEKQKFLNEMLVQSIYTLYSCADTDEANKKFLEIIASYYDADRAFVFEVDETSEYINNTYEWIMPGCDSRIENFQNIPVIVMKEWLQKVEKEGIVRILDLKENLGVDSNLYKIFFENGHTDSILTASMNFAGNFMGFIGVGNPRVNIDSLELIKAISTFTMNEIQRSRITQQLVDLSFYDKLTGIRNRHAFIEQIKTLEGKPHPLGIIYADLNGLKSANDTMGHEEGDRMIRECADQLEKFFPDNVYRIGGDEFVIFCEKIPQTDFVERVNHMKENWSSQYSVSFGQIWLPLCEDIEYYVHTADNRMYEDKKEFYKTHEKHR